MELTIILVAAMALILYFLYERKQRKEKQLGLDLETLIARNDWESVSRILRRQCAWWGALTLVGIALLVVAVVTQHKIIVAAVTAALFAYRFAQVWRLYRTSRKNEQAGVVQEDDTEGLTELMKLFVDCPCRVIREPRSDKELTAIYRDAQARGRREGFTPVLLPVTTENLQTLVTEMYDDPDRDTFEVDVERIRHWRREQLARPVGDGRARLGQLLAELRQMSDEDPDEDWQTDIISTCDTEPEGLDTLRIVDVSDPGDTPPLLLAEVPVEHAWDVFTWLPYADGTWEIDPQDFRSIAKHWQEQDDAVPAYIGVDCVQYALPRPVGTDRSAEVALEHYGACPDTASEDVSNVAMLARMLEKSTVWHFFYD